MRTSKNTAIGGGRTGKREDGALDHILWYQNQRLAILDMIDMAEENMPGEQAMFDRLRVQAKQRPPKPILETVVGWSL